MGWFYRWNPDVIMALTLPELRRWVDLARHADRMIAAERPPV